MKPFIGHFISNHLLSILYETIYWTFYIKPFIGHFISNQLLGILYQTNYWTFYIKPLIGHSISNHLLGIFLFLILCLLIVEDSFFFSRDFFAAEIKMS